MSPRRSWAGLSVLLLSLLMVSMDLTILNVAIPHLTRDLEPTSVELLWIVDSYSLVIAGLLVTASALGDRWGRRSLLIAGYLVFGLASLSVVLVDSPAGLIAVRVLLGVGGAMIMPSTLSMIRVIFESPRQRATALGLWGATAGIGSALGPIAGGVLLQRFDWHAAFLLNVPVMALTAVAAFWLLPQSRSAEPPVLDLPGVLLSITGMTAFLGAIKLLSKEGLTPLAVGLAVAAAVLLTLFVRRCLRLPSPVLEIRLFAKRSISAGALAALTAMVALSAVLLLGSQWLQLVQGFSTVQTGLAVLPAALGGVICSPLAPSLAARIGVRPVLSGGLLSGATGFAMLGFASEPVSPVLMGTALFLVGVSAGSLAIASALIMSGAPESKAGSAAAIDETSYEIGAALGVAILGSLAAAIYRAELSADRLVALGMPERVTGRAQDSLGAALGEADKLGPAGAPVAEAARVAFTDALTTTGLIGAALLAAAAITVWFLTPRTVTLEDAGH